MYPNLARECNYKTLAREANVTEELMYDILHGKSDFEAHEAMRVWSFFKSLDQYRPIKTSWKYLFSNKLFGMVTKKRSHMQKFERLVIEYKYWEKLATPRELKDFFGCNEFPNFLKNALRSGMTIAQYNNFRIELIRLRETIKRRMNTVAPRGLNKESKIKDWEDVA